MKTPGKGALAHSSGAQETPLRSEKMKPVERLRESPHFFRYLGEKDKSTCRGSSVFVVNERKKS
jgi:hypothetical protein